jgi:uncharacterized protein YcfJ
VKCRLKFVIHTQKIIFAGPDNSTLADLYLRWRRIVHREGKMRVRTTVILAGSLAVSACQSGTTSQAVSDRNSEFGCIAGTVGGAIVGGLIGSTIGAGTGQVLAVGGGIAGGGFVGNRLACK